MKKAVKIILSIMIVLGVVTFISCFLTLGILEGEKSINKWYYGDIAFAETVVKVQVRCWSAMACALVCVVMSAAVAMAINDLSDNR